MIMHVWTGKLSWWNNIFSFLNASVFSWFHQLNAATRSHHTRRWLWFLSKDNQWILSHAPRPCQQIELFTFFGADSPISLQCLDSYFVSGAKLMNPCCIRGFKSTLYCNETLSTTIETSPGSCFCSIWTNAAVIVSSFLMFKLSVTTIYSTSWNAYHVWEFIQEK